LGLHALQDIIGVDDGLILVNPVDHRIRLELQLVIVDLVVLGVSIANIQLKVVPSHPEVLPPVPVAYSVV